MRGGGLTRVPMASKAREARDNTEAMTESPSLKPVSSKSAEDSEAPEAKSPAKVPRASRPQR